ncbi:MAG: outer membrane protein assembly factor BamE [Opitutales bacterium]|nr:outer membrane protein assembly factor BamE [Opitutales bacterium]
MKYRNILSILAFGTLPFMSACSTTNDNNNYYWPEEQMTVAKVQREIRIGMPSSSVIDVLGSPNMVTTDSERRETWVYDKVSTNIQASASSSGAWILFFGGSSANHRASSNQRTLTIVVKFDEDGFVRDFAYRTSTF